MKRYKIYSQKYSKIHFTRKTNKKNESGQDIKITFAYLFNLFSNHKKYMKTWIQLFTNLKKLFLIFAILNFNLFNYQWKKYRYKIKNDKKSAFGTPAPPSVEPDLVAGSVPEVGPGTPQREESSSTSTSQPARNPSSLVRAVAGVKWFSRFLLLFFSGITNK